MNQIAAGYKFGHRMLDLKPRIHLEEEEVAFAIDQKLNRARVLVARGARDADGGLAHSASQILIDDWRWALLEHLLMTPLKRAFALTKVDDIPEAVADQLNLDVSRRFDVLLDVDRSVVEARRGFGTRKRKRARNLVARADQPHAFSAAARSGFEHHRISDFIGNAFRVFD